MFFFSPLRGDKKAICNKFVQTVSEHQEHDFCLLAFQMQIIAFGVADLLKFTSLFPAVFQSAVTCLLWPAEHAIVYGLVDGKVGLQHVLSSRHKQQALLLFFLFSFFYGFIQLEAAPCRRISSRFLIACNRQNLCLKTLIVFIHLFFTGPPGQHSDKQIIHHLRH